MFNEHVNSQPFRPGRPSCPASPGGPARPIGPGLPANPGTPGTPNTEEYLFSSKQASSFRCIQGQITKTEFESTFFRSIFVDKWTSSVFFSRFLLNQSMWLHAVFEKDWNELKIMLYLVEFQLYFIYYWITLPRSPSSPTSPVIIIMSYTLSFLRSIDEISLKLIVFFCLMEIFSI